MSPVTKLMLFNSSKSFFWLKKGKDIENHEYTILYDFIISGL